MTTPAVKLASLLETLPSDERKEITAWLLDRGPVERSWMDFSAPLENLQRLTTSPESRRRLTSPLATGDTQLVTIRLPAERHAQLRDWCTDHGFTMAGVVRGLVDRFIDEQNPQVG